MRGAGGGALVPGLSEVVEIHASGEGNLVLKADGTVAMWGTFARPADVLTNVESLSASGELGAAVMQDGAVRVWSRRITASTPLTGLTHAIPAACTDAQVLVLRADGTVVAWRSGEALDKWALLDAGPIREVTARYAHWVLLGEEGFVIAGGANNLGQTNVPPGLAGLVEVVAGDNHTLALRSDGTVTGWGAGFTNESPEASQLEAVVAVGAGGSHSLAIVQERQPPMWVRSPRSRQVPTGVDVLLRARALGTLPLRYQWLRKIWSGSSQAASPWGVRPMNLGDLLSRGLKPESRSHVGSTWAATR